MASQPKVDPITMGLPALPEGWAYAALGDLLQPDGLSYGIVQPGGHDSDGVPVLRVKNLQSDGIRTDDVLRVNKNIERQYRRSRLKGGEVLLSLVGSVGVVAVAPASLCGWNVARAIAVMRVAGDTCYWIKYYLSSDNAQNYMRMWQNTTVQATLNLRDVRRIPVAIPPVRERVAIVTMLRALDGKVAVNGRIACTSLALAQAQYDEAAKSESWRSLRMGQSARWLSGGTPSTTERSYWNGNMPWISALSLKSPWITDSDRKVTPLGIESGTRTVPRDTVLFVVRGSSLDSEFRIGLTQREVAFGQDCKALLAADGIDPVVLFLAIRSRSSDVLNLVDHAGHGAGRLATDLITNVLVRLPDPSLQATICGHLRRLVDLGAGCQSENRTLLELRNTLLPKLMSGAIRVREAERIVEGVT